MNHLRRGVWLACAALGLLVAGLPGANGQESRGSISGRVIDAQGGVVPGATVTVVNVGTAATAALTTNAVGQYTALLLEPGTYRVTFATGAHFARTGQPSFYPEVVISFSLTDPDAHYHVPLLLSPYAFSTYRGS